MVTPDCSVESSRAGSASGIDGRSTTQSLRFECISQAVKSNTVHETTCGLVYGWLQVKCHRCGTEATIPLEHVRGPRDTPIWKLEAELKCRSCRTPRYSPRVHVIKLTQQREIAQYKWVHPDDDR
jgi:hypothetical protein